MGYKPEIHNKSVPLHGYRGDKREQKAHIVIPRVQVGSSSNDIGFERTKEGFILHASAYDHAWRESGNKIKQLNLTYIENKIRKTVSGNSAYHITKREQREDGKIEIRLRIWS